MVKRSIIGILLTPFRKMSNKITIWNQSNTGKDYKELIVDIIQYGLIFNASVTILSKGWFPFTIFTIIGWGCISHIIHEYPKFWAEEIFKRK